jgi:hypothetical protein
MRDERFEVRAVVLIELQRPRERFDNLRGGVAVTTPFEPEIVVCADAREQGELFAPQPGYTPRAARDQASLLGSDALAAGAQVASERVGALSFQPGPTSADGCQGEA